MNLALVVVDGKAGTYTRFLNRVRDVRVRAEQPLTAVEIEEFRVNPDACVEGYVPPEPRVA